MVRKPQGLLLVCLVLGWSFDLLFWEQPLGLNAGLFSLALLGVGGGLAWFEKKRPAWLNLGLAALIVLFGAVFFFRMEMLTRMVAFLLLPVCLMLLAFSFTQAHWIHYRLVDYITGWVRLVGNLFARPISLLGEAPKTGDETRSVEPAWKNWARGGLPVLRGLLLALPIVLVLGALLASADLVFASRMKAFFDLFDLNHLPEYIFRFCLILGMAYALAGVFLYVFAADRKEERPDPQKAWFPAFLGTTEAAVVLGSVVILFLFFVILQFRYLFGGNLNISETGFTYAEYARKGFFELLVVAILSLGLVRGLNLITRRQTERQQRLFSGLVVAVISLVLVILASSWQRLSLYEAAYGFTHSRIYAHVFIPCLAGLLLAMIVLEILRETGRFAAALLATSLIFGLTLFIINPETLIVRQNVARAQAGEALDVATLSTLSSDATPELYAQFVAPDLPQNLRDSLGAALSCQAERHSNDKALSWQGLNWSQTQAQQIFVTHAAELAAYAVKKDPQTRLYVMAAGGRIDCSRQWMD